MKKITLLQIIVFALFVAVVFSLCAIYFLKRAQPQEAQRPVVLRGDEEAYNFAKLFIDKIMLSQGTVSFDDRLELENAVRAINDKEIFAKWQQFLKSKTNKEAQITTANLLNVLLDKIYR